MKHIYLSVSYRARYWFVFFLLLTVVNGYAQQQTITIESGTLEQAILKIRTMYTVVIAYNTNDVQDITVQKKEYANLTVEQVLTRVLKGTSLTYKKNGTSYILQKIPARDTQAKPRTGSIMGTVLDQTGEGLPGTSVRVVGLNTGIQTDAKGAYSISLEPGTYTLEVSFISYQTQQITGVVVEDGQTVTLHVAMKPTSNTLSEVVVTGTVKANTLAGLLVMQKKSAVMSDGISAQQIAKTPDNDVAQALKRITGITTVDNKYVVVRSMGERWNTAAMDGINMPSTEAYNNNFSFDIIPTAMVESVVVSKTATPDMNASFAGGYVEIKTKDIPDENFTSVVIGGGYNTITTGKDVLTRQRGSYDYLGYDDGTRDFPHGLQPISWNDPLFFDQSKQFINDNFSSYWTKAKPNSNFQLAMGRNYALKGNNYWGFAGALTLRNEQNKLEIEHTGRGNWLDNASVASPKWKELGLEAPVTFYNFQNKGASYTYNSTLAGMLNFGLQFGSNRISLRNTYTHLYDNTVTRVTGWNEYTGGSGYPENAEQSFNYFYLGIIPNNDPAQISSLDKPYTDNTNYPVYQLLMQNKLEGTHQVGGAELNWFAARTSVSADTKDYTQHQTRYSFIGNETFASHQVYNSGDNFSRGYIESRETDYNYGVSAKWSLNIHSLKNEIKVGYAGASKHNTNQQEKFFLRVDENRDVPNPDKNFLGMPGALASWFDGSHYTPGGIGWQTRPLYTDKKFEGKVAQHAPYLMLDNHFRNRLRLVWGVRAEYFKYELVSQQMDEADGRNIVSEPLKDKPWQWMPSVNFTYSPTDKINLRLAYNKAVIRPQFNERTGLPYFDPIANGLIFNAPLTSSVINNYDFKFEYFLAPGELISAGVYYKNIDRPIEREGYISNEGNLYLYNGNSKNARLKGIELEVRKSLGFIVHSAVLDHLFVNGNFTYNQTTVVAFKDRYNTSDADETYEVDRPLYGQTPYAYNLGLMYDGNRLGLNFLYNAKGDQYITVGYAYNGEEIQRPYAMADAQVSYRFLKNRNLEFKFNAKNLFNRVKEYYNNHNSYSVNKGTGGSTVGAERESWALLPGTSDKYDKDIDRLVFRAYSGRTFSASINYTF